MGDTRGAGIGRRTATADAGGGGKMQGKKWHGTAGYFSGIRRKAFRRGTACARRAEGTACGGGGEPARTGAEAADTADDHDGNLK